MSTTAAPVRYRVTTKNPTTVTWSYDERPHMDEIDAAIEAEFQGVPRERIMPKARPDDDVFALEEVR